MKRALTFLDKYETDRYRSYTHKEAGEMFLMGRLLIRTNLSDLLKCPPAQVPLHLSPEGKPFLIREDYHFSLTHTGRWLGFIFSEKGSVGVDLEIKKERKYEELAARFFSSQEQIWLRESEGDLSQKFYRIWTQKEAILKATGEGLSERVRELTVPCAEGREKKGAFMVRNFFPTREIIGAVAVPG